MARLLSSLWTPSKPSNAPQKQTPRKLTTSPRRLRTASHDPAAEPAPLRRRINSREIPRTYSGLYGDSDDFTPIVNQQAVPPLWILLSIYLTLVGLVLIWMTLLTDEYAWTYTNVLHFVVTLIYIHWLKGSLLDDHGEMSAWTLWEQLEAVPGSRRLREVLFLAPTVLTWGACHFGSYEPKLCAVNVVAWCASMLAKLPFMNGVRLFGINRTAGIDDDLKRR